MRGVPSVNAFHACIVRHGRFPEAPRSLVCRSPERLQVGSRPVARLDSTGVLDPSFGPGTGKVITDLGGNDEARSLALQADGQVLLAGSTDALGSEDLALARYDPARLLACSVGVRAPIIEPAAEGV